MTVEIDSISIVPSSRDNKRAMALIKKGDKEKKIHFGDPNAKGKTFFDNKILVKKRENYIARHSVNQDWTDFLLF